MAKSRVMGMTVEMRKGHGMEVVFYRYDPDPSAEQRAMGFTDWMQRHGGLTRASCRRVERIVRGGNVIIWPDSLAVAVETDDMNSGDETTQRERVLTEEEYREWLLARVRALGAANDALEAANRGLARQVAATEDVLLRLVMERRAGEATAVEDAFRLLIDAGRLEAVGGEV